jgi:thymidylate synthase ThyX
VTALLHSHGTGDFDRCRERAAALGPQGRLDVVRAALAHLGPHDSVPREFEHASLQYELVVSAACFGQLKRHRMATLTTQDYDLHLGITIPPSFEPTGLVAPLKELRDASEGLWHMLRERVGAQVAPYVLLNAHRRRVLWTANVRELYHVARLRLDSHAQWDIRRLAGRIIALAQAEVPSLLLLACGKDQFDELRAREFGG